MPLVVKKLDLKKQNLEEIAETLSSGLRGCFESCTVEVVTCPDLREAPFELAAPGLGGQTAIADVGGPPYLIPLVNRNKTYTFAQVASAVNVGHQCFLLGASAGPFHRIGQNCELIPNVLLKQGDNGFEVINNNTHFSKVDPHDTYSLHKSPYSEFGLLGNFFASEGNSDRVLKIVASGRICPDNFITTLRKVLHEKYGEDTVSLGGAFLIESGKAKLHIMPDFSTTPLTSDEDVNNWLRFFEMNSPLVCLTAFHSHDPGLDLRVEHTHCFSTHNQGGHYHYDTTPQDVRYVAYLNVAQAIYRIDPPSQTHQIGRD